MKKKELILILAYCNTKEKKKTLFELLESLQKFREDYSVLVASHSPLDTLYFDYFDYYYFDKNNTILTDIEYRQNSWFMPFDNYIIWSSFIEVGNTMKAIFDLIVPSVNIAKSLNYKKIHMFEYDAKVSSSHELKENSKLLDEYDYIVYGTENTHKLVGSLITFKTDSVVQEWKNVDENLFENLFYGKYPKVPENIMFELIDKQTNVYKKNFDNLKGDGIDIAKLRGNPINWNVPFYDPKDNKLKFLCRNMSETSYSIKIIVNNSLTNINDVKPNTWRIIDLMDNFYNTENLVVFKNDIKTLELDFKSDEFKNKFIYYNSVLDNSSIGIK